ncbi:MAG: redoxin domain-containing protein [Candidatus Omnitrophica bacterium]|nr:redoxin domain-containing protein [Candidatus Omnitrophota bacterium]
MIRVVRNLFLILFVLSSVFVSGGCVQAQNRFENSLIGNEAPNSSLEKLKGGSGNFQDEISGKKAVIIFWATWCPHCREQLQAINTSKAELDQKDIAVLLVDIGESKAQVNKFLKDKGYDFDVFMDKDSKAAELYQVLGIPTIVLVGSDGKVRGVQYQFPQEYEEILK